MGPAISDYPQINELCSHIRRQDMPMSVASFRADSVTQELVDALAQSGQRTLTLAPEAGSEKSAISSTKASKKNISLNPSLWV